MTVSHCVSRVGRFRVHMRCISLSELIHTGQLQHHKVSGILLGKLWPVLGLKKTIDLAFGNCNMAALPTLTSSFTCKFQMGRLHQVQQSVIVERGGARMYV
eukprot:149980-Pelagomonas_calceolata.AAC.1